MKELKMEVQEASIFIIKASIIRDIIKDVYALLLRLLNGN